MGIGQVSLNSGEKINVEKISTGRTVPIQLKRNANAHLELARGDALPKLAAKPEVAQRGRHPTQCMIEL